MSQPLFLGLDSSTQSLKASLLSKNLDIISELAINFDADLPHYGTKGGVTHGPATGEVSSPVMMIVEAVDLLFERIQDAGWNVGDVVGVCAAGQQHASVYWSSQSSHLLSNPNPTQRLVEQLPPAFSRKSVPNWQDSSTTSQCRAIESALGGPEALAQITGSKAHERFTGPQIMRFAQSDPTAYAATERISLVSSFMTTILCLDGEVKGIDESDVCGMNLWTMNTLERGWNEKVLSVVAGGGPEGGKELARKLGKVEVDGGRVVGKIGKWYRERFGFAEDCCVFPGTGDNPATFLSLTLRPTEGLISLGTSDVVLVSTSSYNPHPEYHAFFHPAQIAPPSGDGVGGREKGKGEEGMKYFNMLVYKNGSLAREHVRDKYFNKSWDEFNSAVEALRPKSGSDLPNKAAFWWLLPDIIPDNASGVYHYLSQPASDPSSEVSEAKSVPSFTDVREEALGILESQLLNYRSRSSIILNDSTTNPSSSSSSGNVRLGRVYATGGASANPTILSLMADILSSPICKPVEHNAEKGWVDAHWNACSVGTAYKARWGWERHVGQGGRKGVGFDVVVDECRRERSLQRGLGAGEGKGEERLEEEGIRVVAVPGPGAGAYDERVEWWRGLEERALRESRGLVGT